ncbi:MAG: ABC transporter permease [Bacteroidales bacterium]|nr:ABC transporter permease [Bacteroidales bacterium]
MYLCFMNLNIFLADKIGSKADSTGRLSRTGTVISVVSVSLSIAVIIVATAVSNGFRSEIGGKARGFSGDIVLASPGEDIVGESGPVRISYKERIRELPFVERVEGVSYRHGILKTPDEIGGVLFKGVDSTCSLDFYARYLDEGRLPEFTGNKISNEIMISRRLADMLNYKVGDKVDAYFVGEQVRVRRFNLVGIFGAQLEQLDKYLAVADIRHIARLNGWDDGVSGYELYLASGASRQDMEAIDDVIYSNSTEGDSPVAATSMQEKYYVLFDWLRLLDVNVFILLALMISVAGFNMVSGLLIMLFERISQIGLLKAMGMTNMAVSRIFLTKSAMVVLRGMLWGNAAALLLCLLQKYFGIITLNPDNYFVSAVPVDFSLISILGMNLVAFVAIMLIMLLPCMFISRISPAATMRVK